MAFSDDLIQLMATNWSFSNNYTFQFIFTPTMMNAVKWNDDTDGKNINLYIVSADTPDFTNNPIEVYTGGNFRIHNGKDQLYRFTVTFRDFNNMNLYRKFINMYRLQKNLYFDDIATKVIITKGDDYGMGSDIKLMTLDDTMIEGVSNLSYNTTNEAQVAEFTVRFKSMSPQVFSNPS